MSLSVAGVWQVGVWDQTVWADGVWREGAAEVVVAPSKGGGVGSEADFYSLERQQLKALRRKYKMLQRDDEEILALLFSASKKRKRVFH